MLHAENQQQDEYSRKRIRSMGRVSLMSTRATELALDYIMGEARKIDCEFLQSNNFAFGGINTSIIIKRWP